MKLDDIDILVQHRAEYNKRWSQLKAVEDNDPETISVGGQYIKDWDILHKVGGVIREGIQQKLNEAKATMMALGVTEFPE